MSSDTPGTLVPGANLEELRAAVKQLQDSVALLATPRSVEMTPGPSTKTHAFMIMPFGRADLQVVYNDFVKPVLESRCALSCIRGDDIFGSNVVMDDVRAAIASADIVIADLTEKNANVFYEVGISHALDKPVLLLAQSLDDVPFDLRHRRVLLYEYTPQGCKHLEVAVVEHVLDMLARSE